LWVGRSRWCYKWACLERVWLEGWSLRHLLSFPIMPMFDSPQQYHKSRNVHEPGPPTQARVLRTQLNSHQPAMSVSISTAYADSDSVAWGEMQEQR
jgi:hypothetical protein